VALSVIVELAPDESVARVQVTGMPPVHVQPDPEAETNETPAGRKSVTTTFVAADGPRFLTASVQVSAAPTFTLDREDVLVIERSATGTTVVVSESTRSRVSGSWIPESTLAVLVNVTPVTGARTVTVIAGAGPTAIEPRVHVTVPDANPHVHPAPDAETNVKPTGRTSLTETNAAGLGPPLSTASV